MPDLSLNSPERRGLPMAPPSASCWDLALSSRTPHEVNTPNGVLISTGVGAQDHPECALLSLAKH
jgi:hypothetical protein